MSKLPTPSDILGSSFQFLPQESQLLLITSVLGTSPSWLIYSLLHNSLKNNDPVVFVSFLNEFSYFRDGGKRHGLDLTGYLRNGSLVFVDGFSRLFLPAAQNAPPPNQAPVSRVGAIPTRGGPVPPRGQVLSPRTTVNDSDPIRYINLGPSPSPTALKQLDAIKAAILSLPTAPTKPKLIIEGLDILMAAMGIDAAGIEDLIYELREFASTTTVILSSDSVLIHTSTASTPLEVSHANLVISLGHDADAILSLRLLDTGVAKDISGVLKVTRGAGNLWATEEEAGVVEEKELLYYESDSGVKIFARGSGGH